MSPYVVQLANWIDTPPGFLLTTIACTLTVLIPAFFPTQEQEPQAPEHEQP